MGFLLLVLLIAGCNRSAQQPAENAAAAEPESSAVESLLRSSADYQHWFRFYVRHASYVYPGDATVYRELRRLGYINIEADNLENRQLPASRSFMIVSLTDRGERAAGTGSGARQLGTADWATADRLHYPCRARPCAGTAVPLQRGVQVGAHPTRVGDRDGAGGEVQAAQRADPDGSAYRARHLGISGDRSSHARRSGATIAEPVEAFSDHGCQRELFLGRLVLVGRRIAVGKLDVPDVFVAPQAEDADVIRFRRADLSDPDDLEARFAPAAADFDGIAGFG